MLPPLAYVVTKRICLGLQRRDRELVLHGRETGRIVRLPNGEMIEVHEPISDARKWELTQHTVHRPAEVGPATDANGVPRRRLLAAKARANLGKGASRRLRHENEVPAIVYGADKEPANISIQHHHLMHALDHEAFFASIVTLTIDGKVLSSPSGSKAIPSPW